MKTPKTLQLAAVALVGLAIGFLSNPASVRAASDQGYNGTTSKAASYTVTAAENGTVFVGTAAMTFTLPAPFASGHYRFIVNIAGAVLVATTTADTFVVYNDATADSLQSSTIGVVIEVWSDGTSWYGWWIGTSTGGTVNTFYFSDVPDLAAPEPELVAGAGPASWATILALDTLAIAA